MQSLGADRGIADREFSLTVRHDSNTSRSVSNSMPIKIKYPDGHPKVGEREKFMCCNVTM